MGVFLLYWEKSKLRASPPCPCDLPSSQILVCLAALIGSCIRGMQQFYEIPSQPCNIPLFPNKASVTEAVKWRTVVRQRKLLACGFMHRYLWNLEQSFLMQLQLSLSNSDAFIDISTEAAPEVHPAPGKLHPSRTVGTRVVRGF